MILIRVRSLAVYVVSALLFSGLANAASVTVTGQDDINLDRQNVQDAVDSAPGEDLTVKLQGTFQFDGTPVFIDRSNLKIKGDNATLNGKIGNDGFPDISAGFPNNRVFIIFSNSTKIEEVEITELAINGFVEGILLDAALVEVEKIKVKNNRMDNVIFGFRAFGQLTDIEVRGNQITDALIDAMVVSGEGQAVTTVKITDNLMASPTSFFLGVTPVPLEIYGAIDDIQVKGNTFQGGTAPVGLFSDVTNGKFEKNCVRDGDGILAGVGGVLVGLNLPEFGFVNSASGWKLKDNSYANNLAAGGVVDIALATNSSNVSVDESTNTVILDNGVSNSIVQKGDDKGYCDSD